MKEFMELTAEYRDTCGQCETPCAGVFKAGEIKCEDKKCVGNK